VQRVFDELEENDAIKPQQIEEALRELDLHMDARKLSSLLSDLGNEPVPLQQFIMLIENQHVMDMGSAAKVILCVCVRARACTYACTYLWTCACAGFVMDSAHLRGLRWAVRNLQVLNKAAEQRKLEQVNIN
jgi:hypothetical protein